MIQNISRAYFGNSEVEKIYLGTEIVYEKTSGTTPDYLTMDITSGGTLGFSINSYDTNVIEYSLNGGSWTEYVMSARTVLNVSEGDVIQLRGDNNRYNNSMFGTAHFDLKGNIMSLIDSQGFASASTLPTSGTFSTLFGGTKVEDAEDLILPATAMTEYAYSDMFLGCAFLKTAPALPATTLAESCYVNMFRNCTGLRQAPELPTQTLEKLCYNTMFNGCSSLNNIKCLATDISALNCTSNWVEGVSGTGTFVCAQGMGSVWTRGYDGIPTGWTVVEQSGTPSLNKTLVITNVEQAPIVGIDRYCEMSNVFNFQSSYNDDGMGGGTTDNNLTVSSPFSGSYDNGNGIITIVGPFSGSSYTLVCGGIAVEGLCYTLRNEITFSFSSDSATIMTDYTVTGPDPECECINMGGEWNGSECTYPEPEDPCINDPCSCDPNPDECYCIQNGGTWNSENQVCNYE